MDQSVITYCKKKKKINKIILKMDNPPTKIQGYREERWIELANL